jgi:PIN domain nuclease of toxin-antitoxin system
MLLDTCALVWIATGSKNLSHPTREAIEEAESVYVSSISAFEISSIYTKGGLELPCDPERWFYEILEKHDIIEIELNGKIAIASTKLPLIHKDPCDRFIIATARLHNLPVVTGDTRFKKYGVYVLS